MTIIDFYKELSKILTDCRERFIDKEQAKTKLDALLEAAKETKLEVEVSPDILDDSNLMKLDDENSFTEPEWENESSSYDDVDLDEDSSYSY